METLMLITGNGPKFIEMNLNDFLKMLDEPLHLICYLGCL